jgi:hypothetical protein
MRALCVTLCLIMATVLFAGDEDFGIRSVHHNVLRLGFPNGSSLDSYYFVNDKGEDFNYCSIWVVGQTGEVFLLDSISEINRALADYMNYAVDQTHDDLKKIVVLMVSNRPGVEKGTSGFPVYGVGRTLFLRALKDKLKSSDWDFIRPLVEDSDMIFKQKNQWIISWVEVDRNGVLEKVTVKGIRSPFTCKSIGRELILNEGMIPLDILNFGKLREYIGIYEAGIRRPE